MKSGSFGQSEILTTQDQFQIWAIGLFLISPEISIILGYLTYFGSYDTFGHFNYLGQFSNLVHVTSLDNLGYLTLLDHVTTIGLFGVFYNPYSVGKSGYSHKPIKLKSFLKILR